MRSSCAERTMCLYNCDLALEVLSDVRYFLLPEEINRDGVRRKIEFIRESMIYPMTVI